MTRSTIRCTRFSADTPTIRDLVREYMASIDENACRDEVEIGLCALPAPYEASGNGYVLILQSEIVVGGSAFAGLDASAAEMSRLYVRPAFRGAGIVRALVSLVMMEAASSGHRRMVLHTLPDWRPARALYDELGFEPIPAYAGVGVAEALCHARDIDSARA